METLKVYAAIAKVQSELKPLEADSTNPHYSSQYISFDKMWHSLQPLLAKHGLICIQTIWSESGVPTLATQLIHVESGEKVVSHCPLLVERTSMQGLGSAITYARRYSIGALIGVTEPDDDGNRAEADTKAIHYAPSGPSRAITPAQVKRLYAIAISCGMNDPIIKNAIQKYGYEKAEDIQMKDYNKIVEHFQKSA